MVAGGQRATVSAATEARRPPGESWLEIVRQHADPGFSRYFAIDVRLEASVLGFACVGVEQVADFFAATAAGMYEALTFTHECTCEGRTYLEWEGKASGIDLGGTTIVAKNPDGRIARISLYHRPLQAVQRFSEEILKRFPTATRIGGDAIRGITS
jgi:hypothetical protein